VSIDPKILVAAVQTTTLTYSVNDTVYESGAPAQFVYVVKKGALRRVKLLPGSRRLILQFLFRGDGFGYGLGRLHRDTVQALTSTELVVASRKALMSAATSDARLSKFLFEAAARALNVAEEQTALMRSGIATERTALFLLEMNARLSTRDGRVDLPMTRRDISDYLGLTIETVSRTMNEFHRAKIIQFQGQRQRRFVIRDKKRLQHLAADASDFEWWK